ncbi:DUF2834 domain-containing protein [Oceanicoccus sp. KOV_DT_Chl]|uniref:DUF2834 domain-containing protein n=1 Tax=Oceanicoccus sp. KOV_DT_Chl TaxID=1904639 RepID=UPI000C7B08FC|nr:DUF2834 domain-containing protein [Oceanicoccus sp. KOV_DT_Chl]
MSALRGVYLLLAIAGLVIPWYFNLQFIAESGGGFDVAEFIAASSSNAASSSLSWDLTIACLAGLIWIYAESKRLQMPFFWVYIVLAFTIAYAFAFPLYLFFRQGKLEQSERKKL